MLNEMLLLSGNDIPFPQARITIHCPTMKEISYIGEENFLLGCEFLNFSKKLLTDEDKNNLNDKTDFEVFMSIMKDKETFQIQKVRVSVMEVLTILFPEYHYWFEVDKIGFQNFEEVSSKKEGAETLYITGDNFDAFKEIIVQLFCLDKFQQKEYNTKSEAARAIAEKIQKGNQKVAQQRSELNNEKRFSIFSNYISVLVAAQHIPYQQLFEYSVYQLHDAFDRFIRKQDYDLYLQLKLVGAKDLKEPKNWMESLH